MKKIDGFQAIDVVIPIFTGFNKRTKYITITALVDPTLPQKEAEKVAIELCKEKYSGRINLWEDKRKTDCYGK